jgi:outer membrane lipoprotein-sorting protein
MRTIAAVCCVCAAWAVLESSASLRAHDDPLARSRATYAALRTYSDTGIIVTETKLPDGPAVVERHTFATYYRAPRSFYFEFTKDPKVAKERFVVWSDAEAFHTWWSTTGVENAYPKGTGASAFALADYPTKGAVLQVPPLLFAQSGLKGALSNVVDASASGIEEIEGRRCHKLVGLTRDIYTQTEKEVKVRRATVWVDADTWLVRRILEDTPRGTPLGTVMRVTTTFDPRANPTIDDRQFRFEVPSSQR